MSIFQSHADKPNQIKEEGQEITLRFSRINDNVGKLTWNIPPSFKGCKGNGAYNGIVITVSRKPANYIGSSPKDGQYYIGDPSVDPDLHSGSVIEGGVLVVGAFYDDRVTTELEVMDLHPRTPYYFSAYAVDNVARYHREGVHSYSLPTGIEESGEEEETPAKQLIQIEEHVTLSSDTGLDMKKTYKIEFKTEFDDYKIEIPGRSALTYEDMVKEINHQMMLLEDPYKSPTFPYKNLVFKLDGVFNLWDGQNRVVIDYIESAVQPDIPEDGALWYSPIRNQLFRYDDIDGWEEENFIESDFDVTNPPESTIWFDGTDAWIWKYDRWCKMNLITSTRNPLLPPKLNSSTYWYNSDSLELFKWDKKIGKWDDAMAIYYPSDPNNLLPGDFWFNETDEKVYILQTGNEGWAELPQVRYVERNEIDMLPNPNTNTFWYIPSEQEFFRWAEIWTQVSSTASAGEPNSPQVGDYWVSTGTEELYIYTTENTWSKVSDFSYSVNANSPPATTFWYVEDSDQLFELVGSWSKEQIASFPTDPLDRKSCDLWWNSSESIDYLFTWNALNETWEPVNNFVQSALDPSKPVKLPKNSLWLNPATGELLKILDSTCEQLDYIESDSDPTNPPLGTIWKWGDSFFEWNGTSWIGIFPLISDIDPYNLPAGSYWLNTDHVLWQWNGSEWIEVEVLDYDPKPKEGFVWFNTLEKQLYIWDIDKWVATKPMVYAEFLPAKCHDEKDAIMFKTRKVGCKARFEMDRRDSIFASLRQRVRYFLPIEGQDLVSGVPMYQRLGVGDDGSPDERRELHHTIRQLLGDPATKVELTKAQIDVCIDNALKILRKYGGQSYRREFFFLDLSPNQQIYELKDRCVGFHKITGVNAVYRLRSAFLRGAYSGYDIFGYAALKQLYTLGTFDTLSFHLVSSFIEELEHLFATRITYQWVEKTRELKLYNSVHASERVLVDASIERTEQDLMVDRQTNLWLQRWAVAEAKMILSQSRGKFQSLPGPNGSTVLNAQELITQSEAEKAILMEELEDPAMSGILDVGLKGYFVLG